VPSKPQRYSERGQTIILVAISIVSLLAMAALAIDVVTLYVARSEIQRAADAAALAGAKAMADSGLTTLPTTDSNFSGGAAQTLAQSMAVSAVNALLPNNTVAGLAPTLQSVPTFNFTTSVSTPINNPQVTVSLRRTDLPTFFAHIFGRTAATVSASATAEAYNPANASGSFTPISPRGVKPWLVANLDPIQSGNAFITAGAVEAQTIGETFYLTADCGVGRTCVPPDNPPKVTKVGGKSELEYLPALVIPNTSNVCPACVGGRDFEQAISCYDANPYAYLNCGGGATNAQWDNTVNPQGRGRHHQTEDGTLCLIHATDEGGPGSNSGQDSLNDSLWPTQPMQITSASTGNLVTTSRSVVTIPIFDQTTFNVASSSVTIVGYLQAFINYVSDGTDGSNPDDVNITILNVVGCGTNYSAAPAIVGGSGTSPIPVRLITP